MNQKKETRIRLNAKQLAQFQLDKSKLHKLKGGIAHPGQRQDPPE